MQGPCPSVGTGGLQSPSPAAGLGLLLFVPKAARAAVTCHAGSQDVWPPQHQLSMGWGLQQQVRISFPSNKPLLPKQIPDKPRLTSAVQVP